MDKNDKNFDDVSEPVDDFIDWDESPEETATEVIATPETILFSDNENIPMIYHDYSLQKQATPVFTDTLTPVSITRIDQPIAQRLYLLDNAKMIALFLVVFGHSLEPILATNPQALSIYKLIYYINMPLLVFLYGYTSRLSKKPLYLRATSLLVPAFIAQGLYTIASYLWNGDIKDPYWILWFVFAVIYWNYITSHSSFYFKLAYMVISIFIFSQLGELTNALLGRFIYMYPFFLAGYMFSPNRFYQLSKMIRYLIGFGCGFVALNLMNLKTYPLQYYYANANDGLLGDHPILIRLTYYIITFGIIFFAISIIPNRSFRFKDKFLSIYLLHGIILRIISWLFTQHTYGLWVCLILSLCIFIILYQTDMQTEVFTTFYLKLLNYQTVLQVIHLCVLAGLVGIFIYQLRLDLSEARREQAISLNQQVTETNLLDDFGNEPAPLTSIKEGSPLLENSEILVSDTATTTASVITIEDTSAAAINTSSTSSAVISANESTPASINVDKPPTSTVPSKTTPETSPTTEKEPAPKIDSASVQALTLADFNPSLLVPTTIETGGYQIIAPLGTLGYSKGNLSFYPNNNNFVLKPNNGDWTIQSVDGRYLDANLQLSKELTLFKIYDYPNGSIISTGNSYLQVTDQLALGDLPTLFKLKPYSYVNKAIPYFSQLDKQWSDIPFSYSSHTASGRSDIASTGCSTVSMAMLLNSLFPHDGITPLDTIPLATQNKLDRADPPRINLPAYVEVVAKTYKLNYRKISLTEIDTELRNGNMIYFHTGNNPSIGYKNLGHVILLTGISPSGNYAFIDCFPGDVKDIPADDKLNYYGIKSDFSFHGTPKPYEFVGYLTPSKLGNAKTYTAFVFWR